MSALPNLEIYVVRRANAFAPRKCEWAMHARIGEVGWAITTFDKKPDTPEVRRLGDIVRRSMEMYHRTTLNPEFRVGPVWLAGSDT